MQITIPDIELVYTYDFESHYWTLNEDAVRDFLEAQWPESDSDAEVDLVNRVLASATLAEYQHAVRYGRFTESRAEIACEIVLDRECARLDREYHDFMNEASCSYY